MDESVTRTCIVAAIGLYAMFAAPVLAGGPQPPATSAPGADTPAPATSQRARSVVVIEGQCVNALGAGVENVKVVAKRKKPDGQPEYINTTTTNKTGDFAITAAERISGTAIVTMTKWGFKDYTAQVELTTDDLPPFVDVQMEGAVAVFGIVTDAGTGAPIAGATIRVEAGGNQWTTTSEEDGKFRVPRLLPGPGIVLVDAGGYGRSRHKVAGFEDFGELIVPLRPERVIHIKTVDVEGEAIPGVTVECSCKQTQDYLTDTTNGKGKIIFRGVNIDATRFSVRLRHDDYVSSAGFDRQIEIPADENESHHEMIMTPAGTVSGMITDAKTGEPVNGARVVVGEGPADLSPRAWSDFEGAYKVIGVPPGKNVITVHLRGYAPDLKEATAEAGKDVRVDFALHQGYSVGGGVVDGNGKPVRGAYVGVTQWRSHNTLGLQALTDEQGRFTLTSAPPGELTLRISCKGYADLKNLTVRGGETDYRFELVADASHKAAPGDARLGAKVKVGGDAPSLELVALDGKPLKLTDLKGQWVVLYFWATWCVPCRADIPHLRAVHEAYGNRKDFTVISISLDDNERTLRNFIKEQSLNWIHVFGDEGGVPKATEAYGVNAIPLLFVIDPNGTVVAVDLHGPEMKNVIGKLLNTAAEKETETSETK